jgi:hypothetical protein
LICLNKFFGRPSALDDGERRMIADRYAKGETMTDLAAEYEVGLGTIWRALQPRSKNSAHRDIVAAPRNLGRKRGHRWGNRPAQLVDS